MILTLSISTPEAAGNGVQPEFRLARRDALIGRSKTCDWSLPDDQNLISTRHCQISFRDDGYYLKDISTNGTLLNGAAERMAAERRIEPGDRFQIGRYEVVAALGRDEEVTALEPAAATVAHENATVFASSPTSTWSRGADGSVKPAEASPPTPPPPPPAPVAAPAPIPAQTPDAARRETTRSELASAQSGGSAEPEEQPSEAFTRFISANDMDWARGGFGAPAAPVAPPAATDSPADALLTGAGLQPGDSHMATADLMARAGGIIRRLISGMVVMVEARARAKSQMGAETTSLQLDGNNPIKFARTPEQALKQLLNPKERGFMDAEQAVEDAFLDLQSHQVATLAAIPGSLKNTLERFSPGSIKRRAENMGILSRVIPAMRDAALWHNYEKEFARVASESDEAFMEVFAKEFRKHYQKQIDKGKPQ
jgi:type VI secretion system FHA domain protein